MPLRAIRRQRDAPLVQRHAYGGRWTESSLPQMTRHPGDIDWQRGCFPLCVFKRSDEIAALGRDAFIGFFAEKRARAASAFFGLKIMEDGTGMKLFGRDDLTPALGYARCQADARKKLLLIRCRRTCGSTRSRQRAPVLRRARYPWTRRMAVGLPQAIFRRARDHRRRRPQQAPLPPDGYGR